MPWKPPSNTLNIACVVLSLIQPLDTCSYGKLLILLHQCEGLESLSHQKCNNKRTEIALAHRQLDVGTKGVKGP